MRIPQFCTPRESSRELANFRVFLASQQTDSVLRIYYRVGLLDFNLLFGLILPSDHNAVLEKYPLSEPVLAGLAVFERFAQHRLLQFLFSILGQAPRFLQLFFGHALPNLSRKNTHGILLAKSCDEACSASAVAHVFYEKPQGHNDYASYEQGGHAIATAGRIGRRRGGLSSAGLARDRSNRCFTLLCRLCLRWRWQSRRCARQRDERLLQLRDPRRRHPLNAVSDRQRAEHVTDTLALNKPLPLIVNDTRVTVPLPIELQEQRTHPPIQFSKLRVVTDRDFHWMIGRATIEAWIRTRGFWRSDWRFNRGWAHTPLETFDPQIYVCD